MNTPPQRKNKTKKTNPADKISTGYILHFHFVLVRVSLMKNRVYPDIFYKEVKVFDVIHIWIWIQTFTNSIYKQIQLQNFELNTYLSIFSKYFKATNFKITIKHFDPFGKTHFWLLLTLVAEQYFLVPRNLEYIIENFFHWLLLVSPCWFIPFFTWLRQ